MKKEHCCPVCGSTEAVSKVEAWDAARETPASVAEEMKRLEAIANSANDLVNSFSPFGGYEGNPILYHIRKDMFDKLKAAIEGTSDDMGI